MKILIVGAGCVGLSIARALCLRPVSPVQEIVIVDGHSIPTKGTSLRNSGVLHAGLYYKPNTLKARLCITGSRMMSDLCLRYSLPLLRSGKLLIPHNDRDLDNLYSIYSNSQVNGCTTSILDFKEAQKTQPGIVRREAYLWSPKTSVFDPDSILKHFVGFLNDYNVRYICARVLSLDSSNGKANIDGIGFTKFDFIFNCAGPGALKLARQSSNLYDNLSILPFLGQYGIQTNGPAVTTNLYPVPNPELPFLGIHLTPRLDGRILVGPNAIPCFQEDIQEYSSADFVQYLTRLSVHIGLVLSNSQNYRSHAISELAFSTSSKFSAEGRKFFERSIGQDFSARMVKSIFGIRPQLINNTTLQFENDFLYSIEEKCIHLVNAVSPAFTSCLAIARYLTEPLHS